MPAKYRQRLRLQTAPLAGMARSYELQDDLLQRRKPR